MQDHASCMGREPRTHQQNLRVRRWSRIPEQLRNKDTVVEGLGGNMGKLEKLVKKQNHYQEDIAREQLWISERLEGFCEDFKWNACLPDGEEIEDLWSAISQKRCLIAQSQAILDRITIDLIKMGVNPITVDRYIFIPDAED